MVDKNGNQNLAWARDNGDIQPLLFWWFEGYGDNPENLSMDTLRPYFGINAQLAHDASSDVDDTILIMTSFMKLHRKTSKNLQRGFRGAFA